MNRVKELRKSHKISQQKLAEILNVHQTAVSQWETGRTSPDITIAAEMAKLFNVSLEYLLGVEEELSEKTDEGKLSGQQKTLTDDDVKVALFGGVGEVTDEMWDEVKRFVEFVKQKQGKK